MPNRWAICDDFQRKVTAILTLAPYGSANVVSKTLVSRGVAKLFYILVDHKAMFPEDSERKQNEFKNGFLHLFKNPLRALRNTWVE